MVETGWEPEQVGHKTLDQLLAVLVGARKRAEMFWGSDNKRKDPREDEKMGTATIEDRLKFLKEQTGRKIFDLREVL